MRQLSLVQSSMDSMDSYYYKMRHGLLLYKVQTILQIATAHLYMATGGEKALHLRKCRLKPGCHKNDSLYTDVVLFFFSFFSKTSTSEATARERKIKNVCKHLWEKRRFIFPPQCQRILIITSAFAVPIKLNQWNRRYKLLV